MTRNQLSGALGNECSGRGTRSTAQVYDLPMHELAAVAEDGGRKLGPAKVNSDRGHSRPKLRRVRPPRKDGDIHAPVIIIPIRTARLAAFSLALMGCTATAAPPVTNMPEPARGEWAATADFAFARGMVEHHAQALAMTALVAERSSSSEIRLLAERLDVSQRDEIAQLRGWLSRRGERSPDAAPGQGPDHVHATMPGMRTPEQLARLKAARGAEFDRLFLEHMIAHHEGALVMIRDLFSAPGAGQDPEIFRFASEIESDQRIEITRMQQMLAAMPA